MIDFKIFRDSFGTERMRNVFNEKSFIQKTLDVEAALANSQAKLKIIPQEVADEINIKACVDNINMESLEKAIKSSKHPLVPIIKQLEELCQKDFGQYIHLGATTQDIIDTETVLQIKEAYNITLEELRKIQNDLFHLTNQHKKTVMIGRTHRQQAIPITFGYKTAVWLEEINRHIDRFKKIKSNLLVGQLAGAVGTLASFKEGGLELQKEFIKEIGLNVPNITWHTSRDTLAEFVFTLSLIAGTAGKIANEIATLQRTEIGELEEPFSLGKVGSSTMPHKRNPSMSENIMSLARIVQNNVQLMLNGMVNDHERDKVSWLVEWEVIPESCIMSSSILTILHNVLDGLNVNKLAMKENLEITKGLILSEPIMLALGENIGKQKSHDIVYKASMKAFEEDLSLKEVLLENEEVNKSLSEKEITDLLNPSNYIGFSEDISNNIIDETKKREEYD